MSDAKTINIEYAIHPQDNGHYAVREQKGDPLTNDEALCILKSEMFHMALGAMRSAIDAGIVDELAAFVMKETIARAADEAVKRAYGYLKDPTSL